MTWETPCDVDAAGRDVGGDEHPELVLAELRERLLAGDLRHVAVQRARSEPAVGEVVGDALRLPLGAGEDDDLVGVLGLQHLADDLGLVEVVHLVDELRGGRDHLVSSDDSARMFIGCRMWVRARATMAAGMVAENSIVCRVSGVIADQLRRRAGSQGRASRRPRRGRARGRGRGRAPCGWPGRSVGRACRRRRRRRTTARPAACRSRLRRRRSARACRGRRRPARRSPDTWSASSRVGATISACGLPCGSSV